MKKMILTLLVAIATILSTFNLALATACAASTRRAQFPNFALMCSNGIGLADVLPSGRSTWA